MNDPVSTVLGVFVAAFAIWLTVQIVNRRKPWQCGIWGVAAILFGHAAIAPSFSLNSNSEMLPIFMFCVAGFVYSCRPRTWDQK